MPRKVVAAAAAAALALGSFALATPVAAAKSQVLYLAQTWYCFSPNWEIITIRPSPNSGCSYAPRLLHDGRGVPATNEQFRTTQLHPVPPFKIDVGRRLTGVFYLSGGMPTSQPGVPAAGPGKVAADFRITLNTTPIGTVRVAGDAMPDVPVEQAFSLRIPGILKGFTITTVKVDVTWVTCLALGGCQVGVHGYQSSRMTVPIR